MNNIVNAKWIKNGQKFFCGGTVYRKNFCCDSAIKTAVLDVTTLGVYEAKLNGVRVGDFILAPGWTSYEHRLQVQSYDITELLSEDNCLEITVGQGWRFRSRKNEAAEYLGYRDTALIAAVHIGYEDGSTGDIYTDSSWLVRESKLRYSDIYNGDIYDARFKADAAYPAVEVEMSKDMLIPQEGERVTEHERIPAKDIIITPSGETVIDFGQNMTGYVEFAIEGREGAEAVISHAEVLDKNGNFYNENYRSARAQIRFICDGRRHVYKSALSFFGFRYIRLENWPDEVKKENFTAVVVHSDMRRTGHFKCSDEMLNRLYENIIWGQKGNFLDIPTDCPQRDERLGWTGDAQVFARAASYNFDVERFFRKWLHDLAADQKDDGCVPHVIPNSIGGGGSAAWGDAAVICPWQMYLTYGSRDILAEQYESMKKWIDWMLERSENGLRKPGEHFGDWLGLDAEEGSYKGATDETLIATAFFAYSSSLFVKASEVIGRDTEKYRELPRLAAEAFRREYMENGRLKKPTQTACVLALHFGLTDNPKETAEQLLELVRESGHLTTGFVGTPYLLHALSDNGYARTAYDLMLRREYPSWLYPLTKGATTIWEHWDGIKPDGSMWSSDMNSFNHYAYGSVADWMFGVMAGINTDPDSPAFRHIIFRPVTDERITFVEASIDSRFGEVASKWRTEEDGTVYEFTVPEGCTACVMLGGESFEVGSGKHVFKA